MGDRSTRIKCATPSAFGCAACVVSCSSLYNAHLPLSDSHSHHTRSTHTTHTHTRHTVTLHSTTHVYNIHAALNTMSQDEEKLLLHHTPLYEETINPLLLGVQTTSVEVQTTSVVGSNLTTESFVKRVINSASTLHLNSTSTAGRATSSTYHTTDKKNVPRSRCASWSQCAGVQASASSVSTWSTIVRFTGRISRGMVARTRHHSSW